ncbi:MAG: hypothetical protein MK002_00130 [Alphaproteobacteria bacterium]|nr:hypothetical protein [Alphaproteobacteria bacterium]
MYLKPLIICHRKNTIKQLIDTPTEYGVEIDVRSYNNKIILNHDPMKNGEFLDNWIRKYNHKFLIINIKEEGLEKYIIKILKNKKIKDFFFLDQSFPFLIKTLNSNETRCAIRFSEYEDIKTINNLKKKINWVWVDHFSKFPLNKSISNSLKKKNIKICIVSPEIVKKTSIQNLKKLKNSIQKKNIHIDAVCTKNPEIWNK